MPAGSSLYFSAGAFQIGGVIPAKAGIQYWQTHLPHPHPTSARPFDTAAGI